MDFRFKAHLRGVDPQSASYVEVPRAVMRALNWGRFVRVEATINDQHVLPATIMNVGWGPSFLVPIAAREAAGVEVNDYVHISLRQV